MQNTYTDKDNHNWLEVSVRDLSMKQVVELFKGSLERFFKNASRGLSLSTLSGIVNHVLLKESGRYLFFKDLKVDASGALVSFCIDQIKDVELIDLREGVESFFHSLLIVVKNLTGE